MLLFTSAHTFYTSWDGQRRYGFLRMVPTNPKGFLVIYAYMAKKDLRKVC